MGRIWLTPLGVGLCLHVCVADAGACAGSSHPASLSPSFTGGSPNDPHPAYMLPDIALPGGVVAFGVLHMHSRVGLKLARGFRRTDGLELKRLTLLQLSKTQKVVLCQCLVHPNLGGIVLAARVDTGAMHFFLEADLRQASACEEKFQPSAHFSMDIFAKALDQSMTSVQETTDVHALLSNVCAVAKRRVFATRAGARKPGNVGPRQRSARALAVQKTQQEKAREAQERRQLQEQKEAKVRAAAADKQRQKLQAAEKEREEKAREAEKISKRLARHTKAVGNLEARYHKGGKKEKNKCLQEAIHLLDTRKKDKFVSGNALRKLSGLVDKWQSTGLPPLSYTYFDYFYV